jgi:hypothetical protein
MTLNDFEETFASTVSSTSCWLDGAAKQAGLQRQRVGAAGAHQSRQGGLRIRNLLV